MRESITVGQIIFFSKKDYELEVLPHMRLVRNLTLCQGGISEIIELVGTLKWLVVPKVLMS